MWYNSINFWIRQIFKRFLAILEVVSVKTRVLDCINQTNISDKLADAGEIIRAGGLVVFPTETVYGLGANALDGEAVKKIFKAKGRPSDNPLIVHISNLNQLSDITSEVNEITQKAIEAFWPGPLTLIMEKSHNVPETVTAGLNTVAVRMPKHDVAIALLKAANVPIAAPSANIAGKPSPTKAEHVIMDMDGKVDMILDGGPSEVGLESTILDTTSNPPVMLRPGGVTLEMLETVLGKVELDKGLTHKPEQDFKPKAPGMKYTHYSPEADVTVVEGEIINVVNFINIKLLEYSQKGIKAGVLATEETKFLYGDNYIISAGSRENPTTIAEKLFDSLREFDKNKIEVVFAEAVDNNGIGLAIMNRMNKAAGFKIEKV